jgi:hypothetical protein
LELDWSPVWAGGQLVGYRARVVVPDGVRYVDRESTCGAPIWAQSLDPASAGVLSAKGWVCTVAVVGEGRFLLTTQGSHPSGRRHRSFGSCTVPAAESLQLAFDRAEAWARRRFRAVPA